MEAETVTFDTHEFVKRLTSAGMAEAQAEIIAWGQSRRNAQLADKRDVKGLEARIKEVEARIKEVEAKISTVEAKVTALEVTIRQIEADLRQELKEQATSIKALELAITKQEAAIKALEVNLTRDIREMEHKLTIKLGTFLVIGVTVLILLDRLL